MRPVTIKTSGDITNAFYKDPFLFVSDEGDNIYKLDVKNKFKVIKKYEPKIPYVTALFVNDLYIFAGFGNGSIVKINITTGVIEERFNYHTKMIYHLQVRDNKLFSNSEDHKLIIFDLITKTMKTLNSNSTNQEVEKLNFVVNDNKLYYIGDSEKEIVQYDIITNQKIKSFNLSKPVFHMYLHDSLLIVSDTRKTISTINITTNKKSFLINKDRVSSISVDNKNNVYLGSYVDDRVIKINLTTKKKKELVVPGDVNAIVSNVLNKYVVICASDVVTPFDIDESFNNNQIHEDTDDEDEDTDDEDTDDEDTDDEDEDTDEEEFEDDFDHDYYEDDEDIVRRHNYEEDSETFDNISSDKSSLLTETDYNKVNCNNNNIFTLEPYTSEDDPIQIYTLNNKNKYEISSCITRDEIQEHLKAGKNTIYPGMIMTLCTRYGNDVSGKVVVSLPPNNMFFTYGSVEKLLANKNNKSWFALPLFGGKRRRIGNLDYAGLLGSLHCQVPGYKVYKLYTKEEINNNIPVTETRSDYPIFLYNNVKDSFDMISPRVTEAFVNQLIDNLLK
jgi:hypothetical protein